MCLTLMDLYVHIKRILSNWNVFGVLKEPSTKGLSNNRLTTFTFDATDVFDLPGGLDATDVPYAPDIT